MWFDLLSEKSTDAAAEWLVQLACMVWMVRNGDERALHTMPIRRNWPIVVHPNSINLLSMKIRLFAKRQNRYDTHTDRLKRAILFTFLDFCRVVVVDCCCWCCCCCFPFYWNYDYTQLHNKDDGIQKWRTLNSLETRCIHLFWHLFIFQKFLKKMVFLLYRCNLVRSDWKKNTNPSLYVAFIHCSQ